MISKIIPENDKINARTLAKENPDGDNVKVPSEHKIIAGSSRLYLFDFSCSIFLFHLITS